MIEGEILWTNDIIGQSKDHAIQMSHLAVTRNMLDALENHEERIMYLEDKHESERCTRNEID